MEKHGIYPASYYSWKKKLDEMGEEGFTHGITPAQIKRIRALEKENKLLKELIVEKEDVKKVWKHVIINHLQPHDCLNKRIEIEVRNDNDSRFSAKEIQPYFKENHLNQVFTHPYTPQENGHIESFHAILSKKLKKYRFWSIEQLEQVVILFYDKYNNQRLHSSICDLPPNIFVECWNKGLVDMKRDEKKRTIKFKLKIKHNQISDNTRLKCSSSQDIEIPPALADEQNLILV